MRRKLKRNIEVQHTASHFYLVKHLKVFSLSILFDTPLMTLAKSQQSDELPSE